MMGKSRQPSGKSDVQVIKKPSGKSMEKTPTLFQSRESVKQKDGETFNCFIPAQYHLERLGKLLSIP